MNEPEHNELEQNDDQEETENYNPLHGLPPPRTGWRPAVSRLARRRSALVISRCLLLAQAVKANTSHPLPSIKKITAMTSFMFVSCTSLHGSSHRQSSAQCTERDLEFLPACPVRLARRLGHPRCRRFTSSRSPRAATGKGPCVDETRCVPDDQSCQESETSAALSCAQ